MNNENEFFSYKDRPLVRCDNIIYYGSMADTHVVMLQIMEEETFKDIKIPSKITLKLMLTDPNKNPMERIVKTAEKQSLYNALDVADVWLTIAMKGE